MRFKAASMSASFGMRLLRFSFKSIENTEKNFFKVLLGIHLPWLLLQYPIIPYI